MPTAYLVGLRRNPAAADDDIRRTWGRKQASLRQCHTRASCGRTITEMRFPRIVEAWLRRPASTADASAASIPYGAGPRTESAEQAAHHVPCRSPADP